jgi:hypothetical protein
MPDRIRQIILFAAPTFVGIVNVTHPMIQPPIYEGILHHLDWWVTLHILNLLGFPLAGLAGYLLVKDVHNAAAMVSNCAIAVFTPVYAAFDALAGIGTGTFVQQISHLPADQRPAFGPVVDGFWNSATVNSTAIVGSIAWTIAMLAAAVALTDPVRRRLVTILAVIVFVVGGWPARLWYPPTVRGSTQPGGLSSWAWVS